MKEGKSKEDAVIDLSKQAGIELPENVTGKFPESSVELSEKPVSFEDFKILDFKLILSLIGIILAFVPCGVLTYYNPFPLLFMFIGYVLYIAGRGGENSGLILSGSTFLLIGAFIWLFYTYACWDWAISFSQLNPEYTPDLSIFPPLLINSGFGFLIGILGLLEGIRMDKVESTLSRETKGLEVQLEYPKELSETYRRQYPHNPKGVLKWHIDKKMKEGKTREQAIKRLIKESEYSSL